MNGVTTQYLVEDDVNPTGLPQVVEETVNGTVTRSYTYGLERISEAQPINGAWTPSFYEYDGAGSVRQLTNLAANVTVTDTYEYDAFGNAVNKTGATPNNYLYCGEQYDPDLGLYYLRARYYNPSTGRFLSVDPLADEGQRRYQYAAANPVDGMDPNGSEAYIEYALLPHNYPPVWIPNWCGLSGTNPMGGGLPCKPPPDHWTVKVGWRPLYGLSSLTPGHHPLGHWHHTYISIYNPDPTWGTQTWGVLGENNTSKNQEVLRGDTRNNDVGGDENKISCTDSEARTLWDALMETDWTDSHRVCPSCGTANYKNITNMHHPLPFEFFNSNTYTFNMISNWGKTPPPEQNSPGYHLDPRYAGYF